MEEIKTIMSFEEAITKLEKTVELLEKGELPLDELINVFQEGIALSRFCSKRLDEVEKKITMLLEDEKFGNTEKPFIPEESDGI